jgi:hypothetical protein
MNGFGFLFAVVTAGLVFALPRRLVPLPLLMGAAYITTQQVIEIGPLHFSVVRLLIAMGFLRVLAKSERIADGWNALDRMMIVWASWAICSLIFHKSSVFILRLGVTFDILGSYFLFRVFIQEPKDIHRIFEMVCVLLVPLAVTMLVEKFTGNNLLSAIGFGPAYVVITNGHYRAQGAFGHPILAGTIGGVCLPMAIHLWRENRKLALIGLAATGGIVFASGSSGPVMTTLSVLFALALWRIRGHLRVVRWFVVIFLIILNFIMNDPVYFLMARIDITGGSTGYFRAQLIRSAIEHLNEWWLAGTDYTRHWMVTGVAASADHTDITNHYLAMGVVGGLPLILIFVGVLIIAFAEIGKALQRYKEEPVGEQFMIWTLGSILFGHATTFMSVSYFDQSFVFLYLILAIIGSLHAMKPEPTRREASVKAPDEVPEFESGPVLARRFGFTGCH